jgi:hypothetical protein
MSRLLRRITRQPQAVAAAASGHPDGTSDTPHEMPMVNVVYSPAGMSVSQGMYAPDGRMLKPVSGMSVTQGRRP